MKAENHQPNHKVQVLNCEWLTGYVLAGQEESGLWVKYDPRKAAPSSMGPPSFPEGDVSEAEVSGCGCQDTSAQKT